MPDKKHTSSVGKDETRRMAVRRATPENASQTKNNHVAVDAWIRKTEVEDQRRHRKVQVQHRNGGSAGAPSPKRGSGQQGVIPSGGFSRVMVTAATVVFLLVLIWFMATIFIGAMGKPKEKSTAESSASEVARASESAADSGSAKKAQESSSDSVPKPLVEGDADYRNPDSWVGKTFLVEDDANVRSDGGTQNSVIFNVDPGEKIVVKKAKMVDDAVWVQGPITKKDGATKEGWIYAYALSNKQN